MASIVRLYTQVIRYVIAGAIGMLVGAAFVTADLKERYTIGVHSWRTMQWHTNFGWPLVSCHQHVSEPDPIRGEPPQHPWDERRVLSRSVHWPRAGINITAGILLAISATLAILIATRNGLRPRFSLQTLFGVVTIASLLIALLKYERNDNVQFLAVVGAEEAIYYPASLLPWWTCMSLFFGMACMLYVAGWLLAATGRRIIGRSSTS